MLLSNSFNLLACRRACSGDNLLRLSILNRALLTRSIGSSPAAAAAVISLVIAPNDSLPVCMVAVMSLARLSDRSFSVLLKIELVSESPTRPWYSGLTPETMPFAASLANALNCSGLSLFSSNSLFKVV